MAGLDVFLSYSRADRAAARRFADRLAEEGFSVWWDAALRAGETFDEVIETALKAAKSVVVLWSPRSVASRWVRAEATLADRRNKLIPVVIERCDLPIIFELTHTSDLSEWDGSVGHPVWRNMIKDLSSLVRSAPAEPVETVPPILQPSRPFSEVPAAPTNRAPEAPATERVQHASPRKLDNLIFSPLGKANKANGSGNREAEIADAESTRFYTGATPYADARYHCLELTVGERVEKRFLVSPMGLKIGRSAPADVILADTRVSRSHCMVELLEDELRVSDLSSTNGTFVDGERVADSAILPVGSVLKVGNVAFRHEVRTGAEV